MDMDVLEWMPSDTDVAVSHWQVDDRLWFRLPGDWRIITARVAWVRPVDGWLVVEADNREGYYTVHPEWCWGLS